MAKKKLTHEQREAILEWLAADYDWSLIRQWFSEKGWPSITRAAASYYRVRYAIDIDKIRSRRLDSALNTGLALREERIARLSTHADELEKIKWVPDKNGRLWNEKAWRETLGEIAAEMGHRKQSVELSWQEEARKDGYDPDEIKKRLRSEFIAAMVAGRSEGSIPGGRGTIPSVESDNDSESA